MISKYAIVAVLIFLALLVGYPMSAAANPTLELYGTFHSMGVIVQLDVGSDPNRSAVASLQYRPSGGSYKQGFPLSRVADARFVGSIFRLDSGVGYDVRVTLTDPEGGILNGVVLNSSSVTRAEISLPAPTRSLYAAPDGTGVDCTSASPCDLAQAVSQAGPGEEVVLRGGVYYTGSIWFPRSGTAQAPIVVRNYQGESPVIDGSDPQVFQWTPFGGGIYKTTVNAVSPNTVSANGIRLYPYESLADLQNLIWGIPGLYANGAELYVRLDNDADPNNADMSVSRYALGFDVERDYITVQGLTFRYFGALGVRGTAVSIYNASYVLVENCIFFMNHVSLAMRNNCGNNVIQYNEFYDTVAGWPWDSTKAGEAARIGLLAFSSPLNGRGNVVRYNLFHDAVDGLSVSPAESTSISNETDIYENLIYSMVDDGIESDGQASNIRVWENEIHDVLTGISLAPAKTGPAYAIRNLIYRTGRGNNPDWNGSSFKFGTYDHSGHIYLFHNTSDTDPLLQQKYGFHIATPGTWDLVFARNNSWSASSYALRNTNQDQPIDLDYNHYRTYFGGYLATWGTNSYSSLSALSTATGHEAHGVEGDPRFVGSANGDYSLKPDSPLIDKGLLIPGINDSFLNRGPDMGAFEFSGNPTDPGTDDNRIKAIATLLIGLLLNE
ncbi:MAG: hypothetical protein HY788_02795 [Deltaproteobacteria bacterium]|nr:hypothetical protein [Deltaproteobacteria bacterium]